MLRWLVLSRCICAPRGTLPTQKAAPGSWPAEHAGSDHFVAHPIDGPDFVIIPPFRWRADDYYAVDVASDVFPTLSITAASGERVR